MVHRVGVAALAGSMVAAMAISSNAFAATKHGPAHASKGTLIVPVANAFSGPTAAFGFTNQGGTQAAIDLVNKAGGVLGHQLKTVAVDTLGDPADAAIAMTRTLAQYGSSVVFITGPGTVEGDSVGPIITAAKIPDLMASGSTSFDKNKSPYLFRLTSPDPELGVAMTYEAYAKSLTRVAMVFANTADSQTEVPGIAAAAKHWHLKIVNDTALVTGQTAYQSEVQKIIASKPTAILTELDPATSATFWGQYKLLSKGHMPVMVSTTAAYEAGWLTTMQKVLGVPYLKKDLVIVGPYAASTGQAFNIWSGAVNNLASEFNTYKATIIPNGNKQADYDFATIAPLAMLEAKSIVPSKIVKFIKKVVAPSPGAVVVHSFAAGKKALAKGKTIQYIGVTGPVVFNKYNNSPTGFVVHRWSASGTPTKGTVLDKSLFNGVVIPN